MRNRPPTPILNLFLPRSRALPAPPPPTKKAEVRLGDVVNALVVHYPTHVADKYGLPGDRPPGAYLGAICEKVHRTMMRSSNRVFGSVAAAAAAAADPRTATFHYDANTRLARLWRIRPVNVGGRPRANQRAGG